MKQKLNLKLTPHVAESLKARLLKDEPINLTKTKAYQILEYETFSGERAVRENHVQMLFDEFRSGRFLWHNASVASAVLWQKNGSAAPTQRVFRINGQHTCWMRVSIPDDIDPPRAMVRELIYEVADMDQLRMLYSVFDRGAPRTNSHIGKVLLLDITTAAGIQPSYTPYLITGFKLWQWEKRQDQTVKGHPAEVAALLGDKFNDLFRIVGAFLQNHYSEWGPIRRASCVAALFTTFNKDPIRAQEWWSQVCSGVGFEQKTAPGLMLRNYMEAHNVKERELAEEQFRVIINTWNKWRRGELVSICRSTEERTKVL
jgi:hypothetical protein